jgi:hypothetical protein
VLDRPAEVGGGRRVVDDEGHAVPMRDCRHLFDVGHVAVRVAEGLDEDGLGPVVDQGLATVDGGVGRV